MSRLRKDRAGISLMSTSSSSSSLAATLSTLSPQTFVGVSQYSSDLQSILTRAVQIAQIPITELQNKESDIVQKSSLLGTTNSVVAALGQSLASLGQIASSGGAMTATSSDPATVTATNTGSTSPATYTITDIQSIASQASADSASYPDGSTTVVAQGTLKLTVGSQTLALPLAAGSNNLAGVARAINNASLGVTAAVLTPASGADYLSVTANSTGATAIGLTDTTNILSADASGDGGMVTANFADATSATVAPGPLTLTVGSQTAQFTLSSANNNLTGLAQAINSANLGVSATVSSTAGGQYYISVVSTSGGSPPAISLTSAKSLLTQTSPGSDAVFTLNGNIPVDSPSNLINSVIPGVTFDLLKASQTASVTVSVSSDSSQLSNALSEFVSQYNALTADLDLHTGQTADLLSGDSILSIIREDMSQIFSYQGTGAVRSLSDLGITMDQTDDKLSFDPTVLSGMSASQIQGAFTYVGSSTSGLASFANTLTQLTDPVEGMITQEQSGFSQEEQHLTDEINTKVDQANAMQKNMQLQMAKADTMIASLESQQNMLNSTIEAMNYSTYGYQQNPNG